MNETMEWIQELRKVLERFDMVFIVVDGKGITETLTNDFCSSEALKNTAKKIFILSTANISRLDNCNCAYRQISKEKQHAVCRLYRMYEFSDNFRILADNSLYGSMLNYVKTGILTKEEMFQAVLK